MGFSERQGKGDHTIFKHPLLPGDYAVDGVDGKDAKRYDEKKLQEARKALAEARARLRRQQQQKGPGKS